jgi:hypothetical protein
MWEPAHPATRRGQAARPDDFTRPPPPADCRVLLGDALVPYWSARGTWLLERYRVAGATGARSDPSACSVWANGPSGGSAASYVRDSSAGALSGSNRRAIGADCQPPSRPTISLRRREDLLSHTENCPVPSDRRPGIRRFLTTWGPRPPTTHRRSLSNSLTSDAPVLQVASDGGLVFSSGGFFSLPPPFAGVCCARFMRSKAGQGGSDEDCSHPSTIRSPNRSMF